MIFRPAGELAWLWPKLRRRNWRLCACLSVEDRSLAILRWALSGNHVAKSNLSLAWIHDAKPTGPGIGDAKKARGDAAIALGAQAQQLLEFPLLATPDQFRPLIDFGGAEKVSIILDITSFPKRYFFFMVRELVASARVSDLVITYSIPQRYGETLAENPQPALTLPGFATDDPERAIQVAIAGVGFEPLGIADVLTQHKVNELRVLLPFPSLRDGYVRNLSFVAELRKKYAGGGTIEPDRVDGLDCSQCFDVLQLITQHGERPCLLAPYGPKPMSLAMCLFAAATRNQGMRPTPAYYAQPLTYASDYSSGVAQGSFGDRMLAYLVKWEGHNLYSLSK